MAKEKPLVSQFRDQQVDIVDGLGSLTVSRKTLQEAMGAIKQAQNVDGSKIRLGAMASPAAMKVHKPKARVGNDPEPE